MNRLGEVIHCQPDEFVNCDSCRRQFDLVNSGYYSCESFCDIKICPNCIQCQKCNQQMLICNYNLYEKNFLMSNVKCDRCKKYLTDSLIKKGFLRCNDCS